MECKKKMAKNKEEIIYALSVKYDLSIKKVTEIVNYESVRLPYFGKFSVKARRLKYIKDKKKNG